MTPMIVGNKKRGRPPKARPEAEQVFPSLHRNSSGIPSPAVTDESLPAVNCSDCPHRDKALKKCYGVTRNAINAEGVEVMKYYSCHRIGRIINPLPEWLANQPAKQYEGPEFKVASDLPLPQPEVVDARYKGKNAKEEESVTVEPVVMHDTPVSVHEEAQNVQEEPMSVPIAVMEDPVKADGMLAKVIDSLKLQKFLAEEHVIKLESSLEVAHEAMEVFDRAIQALEAVQLMQGLQATGRCDYGDGS